MIFSNRKNSGENFHEVVETVLKNLNYLGDRVISISGKTQNHRQAFTEASDYLNSTQNKIQEVANNGLHQTLRG